MNKTRAFVYTVVLFAGVLALSGCHSQEAGAGAVPTTHAAPPPQAQMQDIDNNPHIPDAQKAAIKASISAHAPGGNGAAPAPGP